MSNESDRIQEQLRDRAIDVRNDVIAQSANLFVTARRALLASLGAVALSLEEGNQFIDKLVERGEVAESDVYKMLNDLRVKGRAEEETARQSRKSMAEKASMAFEDSVEVILNRLNVPSRSDIEELSHKITQLTEKIQTLKKQNGAE
ncbi:MAG: phasin family protein [Caldilineaceae bacterium]